MPKTGTQIQNQAQWKNERFFAVMDKFSIVQLFTFLCFTGFFAYLKDWSMVWINGATSVIWLMIYLRNHKNHNRALFMFGSGVSIVYAIFATLQFGWNSGFFFLILSVFPIAFLNVHFKKTVAIVTGLIVGGLEIGLYLLCLFVPGIPHLDNQMLQCTYGTNLVFAVIGLSVIGYYFEKRAGEIEATLVVANKRLTNLAATDPVTNLANRRTMLSRIDQEKAKLEQTGEAFTLIMIDIDNFKDINDEYGHDAGDFVLVNLAAIINFIVRKQDQVARWGGDEFLVFLPETRSEGGRVVAEKIRARILTTPFIYHEIDIPVTVTLGVSACDTNIGIGNCIRKADLALYTGKQAGKNRVIIG
jgi:diguanylate cyclase (GGDEF)-like protein